MLTYYINTYRKGIRSDARPLCFYPIFTTANIFSAAPKFFYTYSRDI